MDRCESTLCYRLATRYVPNQMDSSSLSWGAFFGMEEVRRLGRCFAERSLVDDNPTVTREWVVYYVLDILQDRLRSNERNANKNFTEIQSVEGAQVLRFYDEISQWVHSFAVQLRSHDPLCELCEASNKDLHALLTPKGSPRFVHSHRSVQSQQSQERSQSQDTTHSQETLHSQDTSHSRSAHSLGRRAAFSRARLMLSEVLPDYCVGDSLLSAPAQTGGASDQRSTRRGFRTYAVVRWSDLTTNFVRDYERNHKHGEKLLSFRRICDGEASRASEPISKVQESGGGLDNEIFFTGNQHVYAADCVVIAPNSGTLVTASRDGIVKLWNGSTGAFRSNLYNAGTAWVIGMFFMHDEDYILIATTNAQLTVLEFPDGILVQKYAGCNSATTASGVVTQLSSRNTQRYGMQPGTCGPHRVPLRSGESPSAYHQRRHMAYEDASSRVIPARPIVGFLSPTACWFEPQMSIFFFGTADGAVAAVDLAADLRINALLAGTSTRPMRLTFALDVHCGAVVGVFYTSYISSLITAGADGNLQRIPLEPNGSLAGDPRRISNCGKSISLMHWSPPSKYFITAHVDRRVLLWSIGRHFEPLHRFPSEAQEVIGAALHPHHGRIAVLLSDKTIQVYDAYGTRPLATITQPPQEANFTAREAWRIMMERSQHDESGVIAWHPHYARILCGLRTPVLYETVPTSLGSSDARAHGHQSDTGTATSDSHVLQDSHRAGPRKKDGDANETADFDSDDDSDKDGNPLCSSSVYSTGQAAHRSGVVALALHRSGRELHTFDALTWRTWSVDTGEHLRHVEVPRAVRRERLPVPRVTIASAVWTSYSAARILTGGEDGALVTWDPATGAPVAAESMLVELGGLDSDVAVLHMHRNRVVACASRTCRVATVSPSTVMPNGAEETRAVLMRVPSLTSITACCVLRESQLCLGTADARLYFFALRGGPPVSECALSSSENIDKAGCSVVQLVFLNEQNQSLILAILDGGLMFVYSYVGRCILRRMRIARRFESRITQVLHITEDASLVCGDSLGRVQVYDVSGCTSADAVGFRHSFVVKIAFQGATDEITAFDAFASSGRRHLIVASLDHHVRLFQFSDVAGEALPTWSFLSTLPHRPRAATGAFAFVGAFGRDLWDLTDPGTFSGSPPRPAAPPALDEELLLDAILNDGALSPGASPPPGATETPTPEPAAEAPPERPPQPPHTPSPLQGQQAAPAAQPRAALFITDVRHLSRSLPSQEDGVSSASAREGSANPMHNSRLSAAPAQAPTQLRPTSSGSARSAVRHARVSLVDSDSATDVQHSRYPLLPTRLQENKTSPIAPLVDSKEQTQELPTPPPPLHQLQKGERKLSECAQKNGLSMLALLSNRLEAVQPHGVAPGTFAKIPDTDAIVVEEVRQVRRSRGRMDSEDYRIAIETRRLLAERMEEYRKRREAQRRAKKNGVGVASTRQFITPFVLPKPNIDELGIKEWQQPDTSEQPLVASVVARHATR